MRNGRRPLVINLFNGRGGRNQNLSVQELAPSDAWRDHALEASGFTVKTIEPYGFPWNPAAAKHGSFRGLDPIRSLRVLLTERKASIVCAHLESAFIVLMVRRMYGFRTPIVIWDLPWSPGWAYREFISHHSVPFADRTIVFSTNQLERVRHAYGERSRVDFVPFYVDLEFFRPQPSSTMENYVFSSGLDVGRDFDTLLRASIEIETKFKIRTNRSSAFEKHRRGFQNVEWISEYLSYPTFRDMYANASIVVVTTFSTPNACGITSLMEAMAMGKPIIVSDNPALRDYLPPPDSGVVVPIGDVGALRHAIVDLLSNPLKAKAMGKNARAFAEKRFNPHTNLSKVADLFWQIVEDAGTAVRTNPNPEFLTQR